MSKLLDMAIDLSQYAHEGQVDKAGQPYFLHVKAVADGVDTDELKTIAYLHDVCEDTPFGLDDLTELGFPAAVKRDDNARKVKISDLRHNMDISRIPEPTEADYRRLEKYKKALDYLTA